MYVSGILKNKTVNFYKEKMTHYDMEGIDTSECNISYMGELTLPPWEQDKHQKLIRRQEQYLEKMSLRILSLFSSNPRSGDLYTSEAKKIIHFILQNTPRSISFALLETLYVALKNCRDVIFCFNNFTKFVNYMLENILEYHSQADIDFMMKLFLKGSTYSTEELYLEKEHYFHINEKMIDDSTTYQLYRLGEFLAPHRVPNIARAFSDKEYSFYILPIYFSFKSDATAKSFLYLCRTNEFDFEQIEKNAKLCRVPNHIIDMVRR